jgi:hypothetical protein
VRRSEDLCCLSLTVGAGGACPPGCPQGQGGELRLEHSLNAPRRSLSCTSISASKARDVRRSPRPAPPRWLQGRLAASLELLRPPSASSTSGPRPTILLSLQTSRSRPGARSEPPVPHGVPLPCYAARRTRTLHSGPKARALSPGGPGFSPVARLSCRVVLRSCFRPGTRLGLPRLPPRAALGPVRDRVSSEPVRVRRPSPCGCPGDLPTWSAPKGSPRHPVLIENWIDKVVATPTRPAGRFWRALRGESSRKAPTGNRTERVFGPDPAHPNPGLVSGGRWHAGEGGATPSVFPV